MKNKGFSLLELMVVLILISLSTAFVIPSLSRFSKSVELKGAAKRVSAILRYSRSEAVNQGKVYQVLFDSESRQVRVQPLGSDEGKSEEERTDEKGSQKIYFLPPGVQIKDVKADAPQYSSDLPAIEFYPNGGSNGGSIFLDSPDLTGYRIKVHFLTGNVAIEQGQG